MASDAPMVVADRLTKTYGTMTVLDNLTLSLQRGRILGLIGPNGAGKTTAIKILVGLSKATSGTARVDGHDCLRDSKRIKRLVGYMPDVFGSYDNMRVREYLDFFGAAFRIGRRKRIKRIDEVLETTGATYMRDRYVETLSHGMKQRIGIARTLLHDPAVLILDEPANGLDPQARVEVRNLLLLLAEMGKTLIVTSHILPELSRVCDQVAILTHGKLRAFGTLEEIMRTVSQRRTIEIQLASADQALAAVEVIRRHVESSATTGDVEQAIGDAEINVSEAEAIIRFRTAESEEELGSLLAGLIVASVAVTQFRELQTDLEDAFLSVTQAASQADGDGGSP